MGSKGVFQNQYCIQLHVKQNHGYLSIFSPTSGMIILSYTLTVILQLSIGPTDISFKLKAPTHSAVGK